MADRPKRERKRVTTFLEETLAEKRRAQAEKQQRREAGVARQRALDEEERPILAEFQWAKLVEAQLAEEEALLHETQLRESRHSIREDLQASQAAQHRFLADRLELIEPFLPAKLAKALRLLQHGTPDPEAALAIVPHVTSSPSFLAATLRDYQLTGLNWLLTLYDHGTGGILADEMGLGKTLQTIAFVAYLLRVRHACGPHLVVCPLSVLGNWLAECKRWCPSLRVVQFYGPAAERAVQRTRLLREHFDVCVTTYEMVAAEQGVLSAKLFRYVILDEAQRVKSRESKAAQAIRRVPCQHRLLLTGTPLQNNVHELWALLNLLFPSAFPSSEVFDSCFDLDRNVVDVARLQQVRQLLRPIMLRRLKADVEVELPPKIETKVLVPLTPLQKLWYTRLVTKEIGEGGLDALATVSWAKFVFLLMQLRKCCNHPYMFPEAVPDAEVVGEDIVETSGKMRALDKLLLKLQARGSKVLLFSGFTTMLDVLEDYCTHRQFKFLRLDGSRSRIHREVDVNGFQRANSDYFLFLISTRAGGLGLNLPAADTVVLYDSDWNPQVDIQAQARSHRIGQTKTVRVFRLVTEGSAEQRLVQRAEKKLFLDAVVQQTGQDPAAGALERDELLATLRFGCEKIFNTVEQDVAEADIEAIVSCSLDGPGQREEEAEDEAVEAAAEAAESAKRKVSDFDAQEPLVSITTLDGVELERGKSCKGAKEEVEIVTGKRVRRSQFQRDDAPPAETRRNPAAAAPKGKKERPTESECWVCHDGGDLLCCSFCPKVYHPECLREDYEPSRSMWACPQHRCVTCDKTTSEVGGVLFRCSTCPLTFCYEHNPDDCEILHGGCPALNAVGYQPSSAVFIRCPSCLHHAKTGQRLSDIDVWARRQQPDYDDQEVEAVLDKQFNRHRTSKDYGINYQLKLRHYGPRHVVWRTRHAVDPRYHPLLDAFDVQWRTTILAKEQRAAELRAARTSRPPQPWDALTKEQKAARRKEGRDRAGGEASIAAAPPQPPSSSS